MDDLISVYVTEQGRQMLHALVTKRLNEIGDWRRDYVLRHTIEVSELRKLKHELEHAGT